MAASLGMKAHLCDVCVFVCLFVCVYFLLIPDTQFTPSMCMCYNIKQNRLISE